MSRFLYGSWTKSEDGNHLKVMADMPGNADIPGGRWEVGVSKTSDMTWEDQTLLLSCDLKIALSAAADLRKAVEDLKSCLERHPTNGLATEHESWFLERVKQCETALAVSLR